MKVDLLDRIFMFDEEKTIEVILYLAGKLSDNQRDSMRISKLMYLADKTSLEDWGRTITLDSYIARYHGNFGKHTSRLLMGDEPRPDGAFDISYTRINPLREPDTDFMSESDIRVLDATLVNYNQLPNWHLVTLSRDNAWRLAMESLGDAMMHSDKYGHFRPVRMRDIIREVDNLEGYLLEHLQETGHPSCENPDEIAESENKD